jgi:hypothetical protein
LNLTLALSLLFVSSFSFADSQPLNSVEAERCAHHLVSATHDPRAQELGFPPRLDGLGPRGLLKKMGPHPDPTLEARAAELGIATWYTKVFIVGSEEEAMAQERISEVAPHLLKDPAHRERDVHMRVFYALIPGVKLRENMTKSEQDAVIAQVLNAPMFYFNHASDKVGWDQWSFTPDPNDALERVDIDPKIVHERFEPSTAFVLEHFEGEGLHIRFLGWHFANPFGLFLLKDLPRLSIIKKAQSQFFPVKKEGGVPPTTRLEITFDQDLRGVMSGAAKQKRVGQTEKASRIDEDMIHDFLVMQDQGLTISVEVWEMSQAPETGAMSRTLIGGIFGSKINDLYEINSIFYPPNKPDVARYAMLALADRLMEVYGDRAFIVGTTMSAWSRSIFGRYFDGADAIQIMDSRMRNVGTPDLVTPWAPEVADKISERSKFFGNTARFGVIPDLRRPFSQRPVFEPTSVVPMPGETVSNAPLEPDSIPQSSPDSTMSDQQISTQSRWQNSIRATFAKVTRFFHVDRRGARNKRRH